MHRPCAAAASHTCLPPSLSAPPLQNQQSLRSLLCLANGSDAGAPARRAAVLAQALPTLLKAAKSGSALASEQAFWALRVLLEGGGEFAARLAAAAAPSEADLVKVLADGLRRPDAAVAVEAALALKAFWLPPHGGAGREPERTAAAVGGGLAACLRRKEVEVLEAALDALCNLVIGSPQDLRSMLLAATEPALAVARAHRSPTIQRNAVTALAFLHGDNSSAIAALLQRPPSPPHFCACCNRGPQPGEKLKTCGGCHTVRYCSRACQAEDWKLGGHKAVCGAAAAAAAQARAAAVAAAAALA